MYYLYLNAYSPGYTPEQTSEAIRAAVNLSFGKEVDCRPSKVFEFGIRVGPIPDILSDMCRKFTEDYVKIMPGQALAYWKRTQNDNTRSDVRDIGARAADPVPNES